MSTLPPVVGVGMPIGLNHMGGIGGVGIGLPNAVPPAMGAHQRSHGVPPPHSVHQHQQMPIHPHQHPHSRPNQHSHPLQHQSASLPPGPPPLGYADYPEGGPGLYGSTGPGAGPASGGRGMGAALPHLYLNQSPLPDINNTAIIGTGTGRERERDREREREREREHHGDMSPFANSYGPADQEDN